jgi:Pvc16 N-terminal domain
MSNALAVAGVTAVLQALLNDVYNHPAVGLGAVSVSAKAPDIVQAVVGTKTDAKLQVNIFLHQVTLNAAWRNIDLPRLAADGNTRTSNQALALDLHYLLTAYAPDDSQAEALLGYAVLFLHENPVLARAQINTTLSGLPNDYPVSNLKGSGLADQVEMIKITPATLGREELAWLWTALKADYRPTFPFQVSVLLIQPERPFASALPVLQRKVVAQANMLSPFPTLIEAAPPNGQTVALLNDIVTVRGSHLNGANGALLVNQPRGIKRTITFPPNVNAGSFQFQVPNDPGGIPAGVYVVSAQIPSAPDVLQTNGVPLSIAAKITPGSIPAAIASGSNVAVSLTCAPKLFAGQQVFLLIGTQAAPVDPFAGSTSSPSFTYPSLQATGHAVPVRLRVDGVDSPIIDTTHIPPQFFGPAVKVT